MLDLAERLPLRAYRLAASYAASRLHATPEGRHLAADFEEAAQKFALLEEEEAQLAVARVELEAMVETADDAWDAAMMAFRARLLGLCGNSVDAPLYRRYFADIPSHVTSMSFAAEVLISRELEEVLAADENEGLQAVAMGLRQRREALEAALRERTRLEVNEARFQNRASLAKAILNKLRRSAYSALGEIAARSGRSPDLALRYLDLSPSFIAENAGRVSGLAESRIVESRNLDSMSSEALSSPSLVEGPR